MKQRAYFFGVLGLIGLCGGAVALGDLDPNVNLDSARQIRADVLRNVDELGLHATRIPAHKEMELGDQIAGEIRRWGPVDPDATRYVNAVGQGILGNVNRKAIRYHFHVIQSPQINAFAIPGGHVYVLTGLLEFLQSEAELAAILGHEISHVDLRHCVERYQYQLALEKVGAGDLASVAGLAHGLVAIGYSQGRNLRRTLRESGWRSKRGTIRTRQWRCSIE